MIALCLGGAPTVWSDLARAEQLVGVSDRIVVACNDAGVRYPGRLDGWATLHPEHLEGWCEARAEAGRNTDFRSFTHAARAGVRSEVVPHGWYGSSGLYAAQVSLGAMGAAGVILCGIPLEADAGHITGTAIWPHADRYRRGFIEARADDANIRSMGGWTAEVLGRPDAAWLTALGVPASLETITAAFRPQESTMRVIFTEDFDFHPPEDARISVAFKATEEAQTVRREAGEQAIAAGKATEVADPLDHDNDGRKGGVKKSAAPDEPKA